MDKEQTVNYYIDQYKKHYEAKPSYGKKTRRQDRLPLDLQKDFDRLKPRKVLDYGCGHADSLSFIKGNFKRYKYDPAIEEYSKLPEGEHFDIIICTDVMEHIPVQGIKDILEWIRRHAYFAFFSMSCVKAVNILPDGSNAHCTIYAPEEWRYIIGSIFSNHSIRMLDETKSVRFWIEACGD
jgi:SAM-dependent methyltransferase